MADAGNSQVVAHNLTEAAHGKGEGLTATTAAHGGATAEHKVDPSVMGVFTGTVIVSLAMAVFVGILLWKKVPVLITRGLDGQIAAIRARLDEAKALRAEAEALRDEYARKIAGIESQSAAMVAHAGEEAKAMMARAEADAAELIVRRTRMAEDKIGAAERAAIADVRAKAADAAAKAAGALIAAKHGVDADKALVDGTIAGLGRLN